MKKFIMVIVCVFGLVAMVNAQGMGRGMGGPSRQGQPQHRGGCPMQGQGMGGPQYRQQGPMGIEQPQKPKLSKAQQRYLEQNLAKKKSKKAKE